MYVVHLYVEGGDHDGESRALGPVDFDVAENAVKELAVYGTPEVIPLETSIEAIAASLR